MAATYKGRVYQRDVLEWVLHNDSEYRFNILDIAYPLHDAIKKHATKRFHFCCVREECYVPDADQHSVWMTAVKAKLPIDEKVSYLIIKEDEFDYLDKDGKSFIDHLFDCDEEYIKDMINHLARRINMWELTRKSFKKSVPRKCIELFFNDDFCAAFEPQLFDYRALFSEESFAFYGFPGWDEFIKAHRSYYWSDIMPLWVGKYFKKDIIKWYCKAHAHGAENERRRLFRDIVEGLTNRLDNFGPYLLMECMYLDQSMLAGSERPTDYVVHGLSIMHQNIFFKIKDGNADTNTLSVNDVKLLAQTAVQERLFASLEMNMPSTVMDLYFDDHFVREVQKKAKLDFREMFEDHQLRSNFNIMGLKAFINNFETSHILQKLSPSDLGRKYDNRIISWFLSERPDFDRQCAAAIWLRDDGNSLYYLLECCSATSIRGILNTAIREGKLTKEEFKEKMEDIYEYHLPKASVRLFFDDVFLQFLNKTFDFDYREFVLKYIYTKNEFQGFLEGCEDREKIQSMIDAHRAATQPRWERKKRNRYKAVQELVETEMRFFKEMENIKLEYIFPVLDLGLLKKEELEILFPEVLLDILRFTTDLSHDLELMWVDFHPEETFVSEVLSSYMRRLADTFYKYSCGYQVRVSRLKRYEAMRSLKPIICPEDFSFHYSQCQNIPLTRPTRYGMLAKEILKNTPPHHEDYHGLNRIVRLTKSENLKINDRIKQWEAENAQLMELGRGGSTRASY